MALETTVIQDKLSNKFGDNVIEFTQIKDILTFEVVSESITDVMRFLKEDETLRFNFLTDLCGVHFPDNEKDRQFAVVYHMHNWVDNVRIRFKCFLNGDKPEIATATDLFLSANWQERETYDFYGITFTGHPQLKRILNMDEMVSFPMRKEFPMEDGGRTDKDDRFFGRTTDNC
ncbi:MAG: NADH dehydrogenase [Flavobacterium sp. MedPE-SWcel]|uniref:NADH-quinone oxidoreductase subunit C n=1 Tax=uncultured Flavobacterium sp. TaxID=165435 RepID=UPI000920029E|nr:NADH-quinone oxidoreductase subunit C [uncultured Flavobacterium sp.]OIQ16011.1 MAG: NADH dehydrogenase [Flavobacterium sp. MedPE-SWcel]